MIGCVLTGISASCPCALTVSALCLNREIRYMKAKENAEMLEQRRLQQFREHLHRLKASSGNIAAEEAAKEAIGGKLQNLDSINVAASSSEVEKELETRFREVEELESSMRGEKEAMRCQLEESRATLTNERKRMVEREQQLLSEVGCCTRVCQCNANLCPFVKESPVGTERRSRHSPTVQYLAAIPLSGAGGKGRFFFSHMLTRVCLFADVEEQGGAIGAAV